MKKRFLALLLTLTMPFALASCDATTVIDNLGSIIGNFGGLFGGGSKTVLPLHDEDTIRKSVGSYSSTFSITTYDGVYDFNVQYDAELDAGIVNREDTDFYFVRGTDGHLVYYENDYGYGYTKEYRLDNPFRLNLLYLDLLFDISSEIDDNAPYAEVTDITYAGREASKYYITNSKYIKPVDTNLNVILDKQTGAVLSVTYVDDRDNLPFYQSTSFTPNDAAASTAVKAKKDTLAFDFFDKDVLSLVNLQNIKLPSWYEESATYSTLDKTSTDAENMANYSVQYYAYLKNTNLENPEPLKTIAKYIYDQGIKCDCDGDSKPFDYFFGTSRNTINYTVVDRISFDGYVTINGVKYNVVFQGTNESGNPDLWYMTLAIHNLSNI